MTSYTTRDFDVRKHGDTFVSETPITSQIVGNLLKYSKTHMSENPPIET